MDEHLRRLERQAATGDYAARQQWRAAVMRAGLPDPDAVGPLTEWEEIQKDYDQIFWHRTTALRFGWDMEPRGGICKAHHTWGHRGWNNRNAKRKTLRTHRDGSRKNYKIKSEKDETTVEETARSRRRKKRFGGREHRSYDWVRDEETGRWRIVYRFHEPNLDE